MRAFAPIVIACSVLLSPVALHAQQYYGWSISKSAIEYFHNSGNFPIGGLATVYLWYTCNGPDGLAAADFSLVANPAGGVNVLAFNTSNGFLNAGSSTGLLLAIGGCPSGPIVAGNWLLLPALSGWELCLGGNQLSVDCQINPVAWPSETTGFVNGGFPYTCLAEICAPFSVEEHSWGMIKSIYR